jgi:hypothetical protein
VLSVGLGASHQALPACLVGSVGGAAAAAAAARGLFRRITITLHLDDGRRTTQVPWHNFAARGTVAAVHAHCARDEHLPRYETRCGGRLD